jgi:hypothetical protein
MPTIPKPSDHWPKLNITLPAVPSTRIYYWCTCGSPVTTNDVQGHVERMAHMGCKPYVGRFNT